MESPRIIKGGVSTDDRGFVTFNNDFDMSAIKRFYMLENHQEGFMRAWHGHLREAKWITCVSGVAVVGTVKMVRDSFGHLTINEGYVEDGPDRFTLCPNGNILYVPPGYANGHKNLTRNTRLIHFSSLTLKESLGDDFRFDASEHGWIWIVVRR